MDKLTYLGTMDIPGMMEHVGGCIERIKVLENEAARLRFDKRDLIATGNGKPELLALEEARLMDTIAQTTNGVRTNAEQRDAMLSQLKHTDEQYRTAAESVAELRFKLDQYDIDIRHYGHKLQAGVQALKLKTAILNFIAGD